MRSLLLTAALAVALSFMPFTEMFAQGNNFTVTITNVSTTSPFDGQWVRVDGYIFSEGFASTVSASTGIYLIPERGIGPIEIDGLKLVNSQSFGSVPVDLAFSKWFQIPYGTYSGSYTIEVIVDEHETVDEIDEYDNIASESITVIGDARPDHTNCNTFVRGSGVTWISGNQACIGEDAYTGARIANRVSEDNDIPVFNPTPSTTTTEIFLSRDTELSSGDIYLDDFDSNVIPAGSLDNSPQRGNQKYVELPRNVEPGEYYLIWYSDAYDQAFETDETDNDRAVRITLLNCGGRSASTDLFEIQAADAATDEMSLALVPNPTSSFTQVNYPISLENEATINLIDLKGQLLQTHQLAADEQTGQITFDIATLPAGVYFVEYQNGDQRITRRLVKQ